MIKIAYVIDTIESPTGGTEKQLLLLISQLDRNRFSPVLCVLHSSEWLEKEFDLCPLYNLNVYSLLRPVSLVRFWKFVRFLKEEHFSVIHTLFKDGMRFGVTAGKFAGIKKIIAVRRSQAYWMTPFDLKVTKVINRWVDLIIANSHNTRTWAAEFEGFPPEKIQVIHNGIDLEPFKELCPEMYRDYRVKLEIPPNAAVISIVANLRPVKAIDTFISAAAIVKGSLANAHFIIVGDGDLESNLKQQALKLGLESSVHFLGRRFDIPQLLSMSNIGVLSSSSESFSNTIVEYLAAGLPVVCTDVGGAREAVEDHVNGFVVPVGDYKAMADKIITIIQSDKSKQMGIASRLKAEASFSLPNMMGHYQAIYAGYEAAHEKNY